MPELEAERCGVVYSDNTVLELVNLHSSPESHFLILEEELLKENVVGTFHTHPNTQPNLSVEDYYAFLAYPKLDHYILSRGKIWCFRTINGILCRYENPNLPRFPSDLMP